MSIDLKSNNILAVSVHPGWVKTDLGGTKAPLSVEESTNKMFELFHQLNDKHNGAFLQFDGKLLNY